jgi:peptidoglycan-N-acetylglucosamine deacetylase
MAIRTWLALAAIALAGCTTPSQDRVDGTAADSFKLAITIDDLPVHGPIPAGTTAFDVNRQMLDGIKATRVSGVMGFVNGHWVEQDPANAAVVDLWRKAGIPLGNHSWSHPNLNALSVEAFKQEIVRNEPILQRQDAGHEWRWFRYPFLAEGDDLAKRTEIRTFLADRGYRIAGVSMDFSDWQFNTAYARCRDANDRASLVRIEDMYLDAARDHVHHSRRLGRAIYGREIPQVLLVHVGAVSAHMMPRLIALYRSMGARFVPLAEAQADPAYAEDNDPRLAPRPQFLGRRAQARGIPIDYPEDRGPELESMCRRSAN